MKTKTTMFRLGVVLLLLMGGAGCDNRSDDHTVTMSGAFALYPLAVRWKEEYTRLHPEVRIEVAAGGAVIFPVAKDAVVPVMNSANSSAAVLRRRGLTRGECAAIWLGRKKLQWRDLSGCTDPGPVNVYTRADACGAGEVWALFLGGKAQDVLGGVQVAGDPGLAEAVAKDLRGLGFNNINFAYDPETLRPVEGLEVVKIDFNGNGRIDRDEDFYTTRTYLVNAIRDGRFPSPPARRLYFVTKGAPARSAVREFLTWTLTGGTRFIDECGYIEIAAEEREACLDRLHGD
jgi:phosphate transport system substrate-binding protein